MPESPSAARTRRRQWGAETRLRPLPSVHPVPSDRKITLGRLAIIATVLFWLAYVIYTIVRQFLNNGTESFRFTTEAISYLVVVTFLTFSALMYLIARQGALQRFRDHKRVPRAELDRHFAVNQRSMTVLVPSYAEEPDVIRATLWSAALQEYPSLRVVLLLDDPPFPSDPAVAARLEESRALAQQIQSELAVPSTRFADAMLHFELDSGEGVNLRHVADLAENYVWAADWLDAKADAEKLDDHVDHFFVNEVLRGLSAELRVTADALRAAYAEGTALAPDRMIELYRRLVWTFSAEVLNFERKRYASVSHEANKAMNLNAYIGLMGGSYRLEPTPAGDILRTVPAGEPADLVIPDTDYLLTLDADSLLLRDYCLRLVYFLEQPDNARVAVTQTPYSSFRGASTRIERLAGATTDLQHILHQGKSYFNATFWVGANAVIRKRALDDIVETETVGGFPVHRYVQDRTVIEDTESSVDLGTHGWSLVNYPERLSYSATPPDFGSLVVQRRRWANGGLLIMPKLWRQIRERKARGERVGWTELFLRVNYMSSIAWASFGLVFLLAYPYDSRLLSPMVLLAALPYFLAMASDLRYAGYKATDVFRIYGFNLILLPVNLAGVIKSVQQAITGKKIPFARTPKVRNRTAAPLLYVVAPYAIVAFSAFTFWRDVQAQNWGNAAFAAFNALLALGAILAYIGIGASLVDIWLGLTKWLYVEPKPRQSRAPKEAAPAAPAALDWRAVLYHGTADGPVQFDLESAVPAAAIPAEASR
ncbi:glycosyl transferase family 2 [Diaminobutyricimonas aerilata]|uniref:Glycosyl transferase family 2 n=1 Tax=Diaminobutyricimonas aerilata TaxID=1162967 RepID=A0A2M9CHR1_9MICO|nr:glycosyltransferase family 2 protein [Diaminobutyricimonas aerilata]PJJ71410.1 glycosyl transferase family 2 [Diaminobutyricimonas aerilata]